MKNMRNTLAENLASLRREHRYTQEGLAEEIGVTRQAVAKWEAGESTPDILHCDMLAELFGVSLDDLVHFDQRAEGYGVPPRGKHIFGAVQLGERGQVVIPKKARDTLGLKHGDMLMVLGDTNPGTAGLALVPEEAFLALMNHVMESGGEEEK